MREEEIAERLGVSRTPVREALRRLEAQGLLVAGPNRGLAVAELDQQQIAELHAGREVLDGMAARLAAQHASEGQLRLLADLPERFRAEIDTPMVRTGATPEEIERGAAGIPFGRWGTADEVADLVVFLASDQAAYITGAAVDIHGGEMFI